MEVSFTVKNTGVRDGAEVVQLYVDFPNATADHMKRLNRRLVGFERVELKAGEQKTVTIPLKHEQLAYFDDATHTFRVEQGTVNFHVSASSADDRLSGTIAAGAATVKDTYKSDPSILTAIRDVRRVPAAHQQPDTVYDMSGRQFSANANLQKGLYIANGKKIIR